MSEAAHEIVSSSPFSTSRSAYSVCAPSAAFQLQCRFCAEGGAGRWVATVRTTMNFWTSAGWRDPVAAVEGLSRRAAHWAAGVIEPSVVGEDGGAALGTCVELRPIRAVRRMGVGQPDAEGVLHGAMYCVLREAPEGTLLSVAVQR